MRKLSIVLMAMACTAATVSNAQAQERDGLCMAQCQVTCAPLPHHSYYFTKAVGILQDKGYTDIKILGTQGDYCTAAHKKWDWYGARFEGTDSKGNKQAGAVCGNDVYTQ